MNKYKLAILLFNLLWHLLTYTDAPCPDDQNNCPSNSYCYIYSVTGQPYCVESCDLDNGGCGTGQCMMITAQCNTAPCPPMVQCHSVGKWLAMCIYVTLCAHACMHCIISKITTNLKYVPINSLIFCHSTCYSIKIMIYYTARLYVPFAVFVLFMKRGLLDYLFACTYGFLCHVDC